MGRHSHFYHFEREVNIGEIGRTDVLQQDNGICKILNKAVPARELVLAVGFRGHHDGVFTVAQAFDETEHLPAPVGIILEKLLKEGDGIDNDSLGIDCLDQEREFVFYGVVCQIEVVWVEFDDKKGFIQVF